MLLKTVVVLIMLMGLGLTLLPRGFGTLVILAGALLAAAAGGQAGLPTWAMALMAGLVLVAEVGGRALRVALTSRFSLSRRFCLGSLIGNAGGIVAADALLGPVMGLLVWELIAGKTLASRWATVGRVVLRLAAVAALRFTCGLVMMALVIIYLL